MDILILFTLAALAGAAAIVGIILWSTQRAASSAITRYFKAGEYILATGKPPPDWLAKSRRRRLRLSGASAISHSELMKRFDEMVRFFEHCRFFEDERAREQMLAQLATIRERWQERVLA